MPKVILENMAIQTVKADLLKGTLDITLRGRLTKELYAQRPTLMMLADGSEMHVEITPPPSLFDAEPEITSP